MADTGIFFDHVWKKFQRGDQVNALRDLIPNLFKRSISGEDDLRKREFWAVRDVSFEVRPGEALGVIGPNGAGKSTILKLLTRIMRPNRGRCELRGRVGSLIEISAGFHQDLTGRENVFLQGAIMGMKQREIRERFDAIVEFSGISDFIDTPVRRYSSGMNARLGFSIAAHLDPEVLIIDEVLSVGDYQFRQRAFDRIQEMVRRDIAAVVVSHQLERISSLCQRTILLKKGRAVFEGPSSDAIAAYLADNEGDVVSKTDDSPLMVETVRVLEGDVLKPGDRVALRIGGRVLDAKRTEDTGGVGVRIRSLQNGQLLFITSSRRLGIDLPEGGQFEMDVTLEMNVDAGIYAIETLVYDRKEGVAIAMGPRATVAVKEDLTFRGRHYARPSMRLVSSEEMETPVGTTR